MFSKSRPDIDADKSKTKSVSNLIESNSTDQELKVNRELSDEKFMPPKVKVGPSLLSSDLSIKGNLKTSGDLQIEGKIEGNIKAHLLTVGQSAWIKGEVIGEEIVVNGRITGTVIGTKIYLSSSANVDGEIVHKTIAIDNGAHFEGTIRQSNDPFTKNLSKTLK